MVFISKMKTILKEYKGLLFFYLIVAILVFMLTKKIDKINTEAKITSEQIIYLASKKE